MPVEVAAGNVAIIHDERYLDLFGSAKLEDAVLRLFCLAAKLNGKMYGDNKADPTVTTQTEAMEMSELGSTLVKCIQVLLGPVHTTKLHRLGHHLFSELLDRGNLWEGDTSVNESQHGSVKSMFRRSTKNGPSLMLQMLRADETQNEVLAMSERAERAAERAAENTSAMEIASQLHREDDDERDGMEARLAASRRGIRVSLAAISQRSGLDGMAAALGVPRDAHAVMANTIVKRAVFEWGAPGTPQHIRGADSFRGAPWYSHIRYRSLTGETRWGMVRVVLRAIDDQPRTVVVVQRMRQVPPRAGCVLSEFGCTRLAWAFDSSGDEWPALEAVELANILRLEQIHVDWEDLCARRGIFVTPTTAPFTAEERRAVRFFVNVFYPWTTCPQTVV